MYIPEEMKVNKFVSVHLPENCTYFARFGYQTPESQLYTGDDSSFNVGIRANFYAVECQKSLKRYLLKL